MVAERSSNSTTIEPAVDGIGHLVGHLDAWRFYHDDYARSSDFDARTVRHLGDNHSCACKRFGYVLCDDGDNGRDVTRDSRCCVR